MTEQKDHIGDANKMIPIKLYTEEQVREALKAGFRLAMETDGGLNDYTELFMNALTPIELPTDEEIMEECEWLDNPIERINWRAGAEWMRDKILNK